MPPRKARRLDFLESMPERQLICLTRPLPPPRIEQTSGNREGGPMTFVVLIYLAVIVVSVAALWVVFTKAGQPGWGAIVPIYNLILILKIAGKPVWWFLLCLIPLVNLVIVILIYVALAKNFGKSSGFTVGMIFLPFIFLPLLAWGDAEYSPQP